VSIYREYDIRGIFQEELNETTVTRIGYALSRHIPGEYVAVGYDARSHSPVLFEYLVNGLNAGGKTVLDMGMVPTPVNYFANYQEFKGKTPSGSIMITGSHNPSQYNGFKITINKAPFFGEQIYALAQECEAITHIPKSDRKVEKIDAKERYIDYICKQFAH